MKRSWPTLISLLLLGSALVLLGALQYRWQSQISENERTKMEKRVQDAAERFAEDFNREIQAAYVNFQLDADAWRSGSSVQFNERYDYWRGRTGYPELIKDFVFFETGSDALPMKFDRSTREFKTAEWTPDLRELKQQSLKEKNRKAVDTSWFLLLVPAHESTRNIERIVVRSSQATEPPVINLPGRFGYLAVFLDENVIKDELVRTLVQKHFPDDEFDLAIFDREGNTVFSKGGPVSGKDASAPLFDLSTDSFIFFSNRDALPAGVAQRQRSDVIVNQRIETQTFSSVQTNSNSASGMVTVEMKRGGQPRSQIFSTLADGQPASWTLTAQHRDGSIDAFVTNVEIRNLGIGFGILTLMALAAGAIIYSAQRSKAYAQRQVDFVSSVSHEFRTPLAVIYSAGENLVDGVASDREQVARYGELIKGEGKKLTSMVEQILEFAGAQSGRKKYNFAETDLAAVAQKAIRESMPQLEENAFKIETDIDPDLPPVSADADALTGAVQNLIQNSIKYSNGTRWLRVSTSRTSGGFEIAVEDKGIGIAQGDQRMIFEPFYRSKEVVDAQIHGNGLGLSLVKEIAEAHGGTVRVASEAGKGSRFTIELPGSLQIA